MEYKYSSKENFEDFASGRVIYNNAGAPNFPVRLINEIYRRCLNHSLKKEDIVLYDCCCGGAYSLTVLGLCNQDTIGTILGSDIEEDMVKLAKINLGLLTQSGIEQRKDELKKLYEAYNKTSHLEAIESADRLKTKLKKEIETSIFIADATKELNLPKSPDIIITDIPYGDLVEWNDVNENSLNEMLKQIHKISKTGTIIAISRNKKQKIKDFSWTRLEKNVIGKRVVEIFSVN